MDEDFKAALTVMGVIILIQILRPIAAAYEEYLRIRAWFDTKSGGSE